MKKISCSGVIFITNDKNILLEDRRRIHKHGESWSFFGGSMKRGETYEEAMKREIREEMGYEIENYKFFKKYTFIPPNNQNLELTYYMYLAEAPEIKSLNIHQKGGIEEFSLQDALNLQMNDIDKKIIKDVMAELDIK